MGVLFISHSSQDNDKAVHVRDWLRSQGWRDIFLDLDPEQGLAPGHRWQDELKRAGERCAAVLVLISPHWLASFWCRTEFLLADQLGKRIFPIFVAPTAFDDLPPELKAKFQFADISDPDKEAEGFKRLSVGLRRAGLDPTSFEWPPPGEPNRAVYRGLKALDVQDAAIFFGRDAQITKGLDELRRLRDGAPERLLVILGASGAGKSSFLRAGLVARLRRDEENFLVPPVIRPGRAAISGPEGLAASLAQAAGEPVPITGAGDLVRVFAALRAQAVVQAPAAASGAETPAPQPPTLVLAIDQAEELFGADDTEGGRLLALLAESMAADANVIAILTIRSDAYEALQTDPSLAGATQRLLSLSPIPPDALGEVIEGPGKLANPPVGVEPELKQALLADLMTADALPLLAFTLERLYLQFGREGRLTLSNYRDELGGLGGAIQAAAVAAIGAFPDAETLALARRLFVPALVQVGQDGVRRRIARRQDIPADAQALADRFVAQRLLVSDRRAVDGAEVETLEVAHEAILRQWPTLAAWIAEDGEALQALEGVRTAAREWQAHTADPDGAEAWLLHRGDRLSRARAITESEDFAAAVDSSMRGYLAACWEAERRLTSGRRRLQAVAAVLALALIGGLAWAGWTYRSDINAFRLSYGAYRPFVTSDAALAAALPGAAFQDCRPRSSDCPTMVVIPPGQFWMGSPPGEAGQQTFEVPQHLVRVGRLAVSKFDITVAEWKACAAAGGCQGNPDPDLAGWPGGNRPVVNVSWNDAQEYVAWLSKLTGVHYRLLSEAEWEYAARGQTTPGAPHRLFPWGDAVGSGNADCLGCGSRWDGKGTSPVGSFPPNAFGLFDMAGDVQQWVLDCPHPNYVGAPGDGSVWPGGYCNQHGLRGGDWQRGPLSMRSASRSSWESGDRAANIGFRIARTL